MTSCYLLKAARTYIFGENHILGGNHHRNHVTPSTISGPRYFLSSLHLPLRLGRQVIDVVKDGAVAIILAHGRPAQVLRHGARRPARVVALAGDAVLTRLDVVAQAVWVLFIAPATLPAEPVGRLIGLLGGARASARRDAERLGGNIVPVAAVVERHVPQVAGVSRVGDQAQGDGVVVGAGRHVVGVPAIGDVGDGAVAVEVKRRPSSRRSRRCARSSRWRKAPR